MPQALTPPLSKAELALCRGLQRRHGTSYYFATRFLPEEHRWAVHVLYAFFRIPDEIVDHAEGKTLEEVKGALLDWRERWNRAYQGEPTDEPVLRLATRVFQVYQIPREEADAFFDSMEMDLVCYSYQTYDDVKRYMYGSAAIVGRMMTRVLGFTNDQAFPRAEALGYAMQWTNFLRDIDEDWQERKRVYVPLDRLEAHGLTEEAIASRSFPRVFGELMQEEIARADTLYEEAEKGIRFLDPKGRLGVLVAARLYQAILRQLEKQGRNPFLGRARTSFLQKCVIALRAWWDLKTQPIFRTI